MNIIAHTIRTAIIPKLLPDAEHHLVLGRMTMRQKAMPAGVTLTKRVLNGERKTFRARRIHEGQRLLAATWPQDNLHEIVVPKIVCVVSGTAEYLLGSHSLRCQAGNIILIPPKLPHQMDGPFLKNDKGYCELVMAYAFRGGVMVWYNRCHDRQFVNDLSGFFVIDRSILSHLLTNITDELSEEREGAPALCKDYLSAFFTVTARELETEEHVSRLARESAILPDFSPLNFKDKVRAYIEANSHRLIKVDDVAHHLYMSNSHFFRQMHQHDMNFTELLTQYRMDNACRLLRESTLTVDAISKVACYKSATYFHSLFRKQMGCTPLEYRARSQNKPEKR